MSIISVQFVAKALDRNINYTVLMPDAEQAGPGPYPVLVQLHGYLDNRDAWTIKSNLWGHWERYPLIVVLPETANGWWANLGYPNNWEDFVVKDLVAHVQATFPARPGKWAIGGLSMGGFGAIRLGLKHPDLFSSIWAHSSTVPTTKVKRDWPFIWDSPDHSEEWKARMKIDLSCYHWAEQLDRAQMPRLSFDCGTEDFLIEENRAFHTFLESIDFPHHYAEHPGAHTWEYWDTHVVTALTQHAEVFGIARAPEPVWPPVEESS